jgi:hypothetical protein
MAGLLRKRLHLSDDSIESELYLDQDSEELVEDEPPAQDFCFSDLEGSDSEEHGEREVV